MSQKPDRTRNTGADVLASAIAMPFNIFFFVVIRGTRAMVAGVRVMAKKSSSRKQKPSVKTSLDMPAMPKSELPTPDIFKGAPNLALAKQFQL